MKYSAVVVISFCAIINLLANAYAGEATQPPDSSQAIQELRSQIQDQLKQMQAKQQQQFDTLNNQIQTQFKQLQSQFQEQMQKLNTLTQNQIEQVQTTLHQQIKLVHDEVMQNK